MHLGTGREARRVAALVIALGAAACVDEPEVVTCERFDSYLSICYFTCVAGWDCEYNYRAAPADTQLTLDYCSKCLADEAEWDTCSDCDVGGVSCQLLMEEELGIVCTW